jgi:hypothetical protein
MLKEKLKEEKDLSKEDQTHDNNDPDNNIDTIFNKTLKNTSSVLVLSLLSKLINIICNIILVRHISKEAYGTAKIYLEFLFTLICSFPIDTIRKTSQNFVQIKTPKKKQKNII